MSEVLPVETTRRDTQRTYDAISRFYDVTEGVLETRAKRLALRLARVAPGETVLEIGPGTGWALSRLSNAAGATGAVCGVDLAGRMLRRAARRLRGRRAVLAQGDALALPLASGRFDLVFLTFVLELFPTDEIVPVLGEARRVLRPGGRIVAVSLTREAPNWATRLYEWGHKRAPRLLDCRPIYARRSLEEAGFEVERADRIGILGLPVEVVAARAPGPGL